MDEARLRDFLDKGIRSLAADAVRLAVRKPGLVGELRRMAAELEAQAEKRRVLTGKGAEVPPFMIASITKRCNLGCAGCYAAVNAKGCSTELGVDSWGRVFSEAEDMGVSFILLAGGEPLERIEVIEEAARHRSIAFPVFTNGCRLDAEMARFLSARRNLLPIISIEGGREATDSRRGAGMYDRVMEAMEVLKKASVFYGVSMTVTKDNLEEVCSDALIGTLRRKGALAFIYVEYVPADGISEHLAPGPAEREMLSERVEQLRRSKGGIHICFPGDEEAMGGCLAAGRGFVHINPSGGVEPCPFAPSSDRNVNDCSLEEALKSPLLMSLRTSGAMELEHLGGCALWNRRDQVAALSKEVPGAVTGGEGIPAPGA